MSVLFEVALALLYTLRWLVLIGAVAVIVYVTVAVVLVLLGRGPDPMS